MRKDKIINTGMNKITRIDVIDNSVPGQATIAMHDDDVKDRRILAHHEDGLYRFYPQYTDGGPIWHGWCDGELYSRWATTLEVAMKLTHFSIPTGERQAHEAQEQRAAS